MSPLRPSFQAPLRRRHNRPRAFALVVTMAALVLMAVMLLAFFSRALLNRQIAFSSTNQAKSDLLARAALDVIVGELRVEISDTNHSLQVGPVERPFFQPRSPTNAVPSKLGVQTPDAAGDKTLVKVAGTDVPIRPGGQITGSSISVGSPSRNARTISQTRWFGASGPRVGTQSALPTWLYLTRSAGVTTPTSVSEATDPASPEFVLGRFSYTAYDVSGRLDASVAGYPSPASAKAGTKSSLAYVNLNIVSPLFTLGSAGTIDRFVNWRNGVDAGTGDLYDSYLRDFGMNQGFLQTKLGHNTLLSRRDLLNAVSSGLLPDVPELLTPFTRWVNEPNWAPTRNSDETTDYVGGPGTEAMAYVTDANDDESVNRFVPNVRQEQTRTIVHYNDDGTTESYLSKVNDPAVRHRFSLSKLKWLAWNGPSDAAEVFSDTLTPAEKADAIEACFGLTWNTTKSRWDYDPDLLVAFTRDGLPDFRLLTLAEVAELGREPNFFEMLNAGILEGSLGQHPGPSPEFELATEFDIFAGSKARHLMQLGANIIDQYDPDGYPTVILATTSTDPLTEREELDRLVAGVENLPYIERLHAHHYEDPIKSTFNDPDDQFFKFWIAVELWNLHQQSATVPADRPTQFRLRAHGAVYGFWSHQNTSYNNPGPVVDYDSSPVFDDAADPRYEASGPSFRTIYFTDSPGETTSRFFGQPRILRKSDMTTGDPNMETAAINYKPDSVSDSQLGAASTFEEFDYLAIYAGEAPYFREFGFPESDYKPWMGGFLHAHIIPAQPEFHYTLSLECFDGTNWRPYTGIARWTKELRTDVRFDYNSDQTKWTTVGEGALTPGWRSFGRVDPRTDRFSQSARRSRNGNWWPQEASLNRSSTGRHTVERSFGGDHPDSATTVFRYNSTEEPDGLFLTDLMGNMVQTTAATGAANTFYADPDGVVRPADAFRGTSAVSNATGDGHYLYHYANHTVSRDRRRPVILNRPFDSVAEMGYAFRDLPGRNLDFWSEKSADAGLLDLFSVSDEPLTIAGRINFNSAPSTAIRAVLSGAQKATVPVEKKIDSDDAAESTVLAAAIATRLGGGWPLANRADLVGTLSETINTAITDSTTGTPFKRNKAWAEAPVRALSQVAETRTWNLLIDVLAQSGKVVRSATNLGDFVVDGEKRYWLHIAIDRYTGEVVSTKLEPVL